MSSEEGDHPVQEKPRASEEEVNSAEGDAKSLEEVKQTEPEPNQGIKEDKKQIRMTQIVKEKASSKEESSANERKSVGPPVIVNPIYYYKGRQKYEWKIEMLDATACLEKVDQKPIDQVFENAIPEEIGFELVGTTNIKGHIFYNVKVKDPKGERQISRRYTEYLLWRSKIMELWPCVILGALPSKTLMGVSEDDLIRSRGKYIIRFLRSLCKFESVLDSPQVQQFLQEPSEVKNWQVHFSEMESPKYMDLLQKYKKSFTDQFVYSQREQFMYRKEEMPQILDQYEAYFSNKKGDLMNYCAAIRKMAESKTHYFKALNKLNSSLLPDYEDNLYRWIYGESLPEPSPSIMQRLSRKDKGQETKEPEKEKFGLYSSEAYAAKLEDTSLLMQGYNSSTYHIYDSLKFELKEIDSVVAAIEQVKALQREMEYLTRTIAINREQIQSLNSNKTTLKTFFMEGNSDEKKTKLTNDNHTLEDQLEKYKELYEIMLVLLEKQMQSYHETRAQFYKDSMTKAFSDELSLTKNLVDFHIYEQQLFAKERLQRVNALKSEQEEEIKE